MTNVVNTTTRGISVAAATNTYYVNTAADANFNDNEYTTAAGNDLNSGTLPSSPLASLSALFRNYAPGAGDTIYVDSGVYSLTDNVELTAVNSGVRIQGPQVGNHAAVLNRGNANVGNYAIRLRDAANVTLDSLELVGGYNGLRVDLASHDAKLSNSSVHDNLFGVQVLSTALRTTITLNDIFSNGSDGIRIEGNDALLLQNLVHNNAGVNGGSAITLAGTAQNSVVRGNDIYNNATEAITSTGPNVLIEQNTIHGNATILFSASAVSVGSVPAIVQDNVIYGHSKIGLTLQDPQQIAQRNVIYDNTDGINGIGIIRNNRIFHNTRAGIRLTGNSSTISGNSLYSNASGIAVENASQFTIANNIIYDDTTVGIDLITIGNSSLAKVYNNTIVEPMAIAIRASTGSIDIRNNVLSTNSGTIFSVANAAQVGFTSDYNLMQVTGSGKIGVWGSDNLLTRADWYYEINRDQHSREADPQFSDTDGPDGHRGYNVATLTDFGADDDFREVLGSPVVDAGDPMSYYSAEPYSGNRINVGAFGNTSDATHSSALQIQLTQPAGLKKFEVGQAITLPWVSSGFTNQSPAILVNTGGAAIFDPAKGRWGGDAYRTGGTTATVTGTIDTSLLANVPPLSVLQTNSGGFSNAIGQATRYDIPLPDGSYTVRLLFVEPAQTAGTRKFDVTLQGQTVLTNYDVTADAGAVLKAIAKTFTFVASQGSGLNLQLINRTAAGAILSGIEITAANPAAPLAFTANLEFSPDDGAIGRRSPQACPPAALAMEVSRGTRRLPRAAIRVDSASRPSAMACPACSSSATRFRSPAPAPPTMLISEMMPTWRTMNTRQLLVTTSTRASRRILP